MNRVDKRLLLNDLLNLSDDELANTKVRFTLSNGGADRLSEYLSDPDIINNRAFLWRNKSRFFSVGQVAICLLNLSYDTWLLTTVKRITKELGITDGVNYEAEELEKYKPYFGRVIIKYRKELQAQHRIAKGLIDEFEVAQVLPTIYDGEDFPGYDKVKLTFLQLEAIIARNKLTWINALENQKGVYLITDLNNGKQYVGSAYGENGMLLKRWRDYVTSGHGGNKELKTLVASLGFEYVKIHFQYSLLENYNARIDKSIILQMD